MTTEPQSTYTIHPVQNLDFWRVPILAALTEIREKTEGRYSGEQIFDTFRDKVNRPDVFALWMVVEAGENGPLESVVALVTLDLWVDECYKPFTFISRVWGKAGVWERNLLQMVMPKIEEWGRERTPARQKPRFMLMGGRVSRCQHGDKRETAALMYEREGKRFGFVRRETIFEKELQR